MLIGSRAVGFEMKFFSKLVLGLLISQVTFGAASPKHWSIEEIRKIPPLHCNSESIIDSFISVKLNDSGLRPSREADARTLVRRLFYEVIGLPPTPAQVDQFVSD